MRNDCISYYYRERELMFLAVLLAIFSATFLAACSAEQSNLMSTFYNYSS